MAPKAKAVAKEVEKKEDETLKRKAADSKEAPEAKEAKKEEEKVEHEKDAPADKRPALKEDVAFEPAECTMNVLPTMQGKVLMSLSDGGMQFLIAGCRANVGIKAGRYLFEAKVIEALNPAEAAGNRGKVPLPRQLLRVGFSTKGSQLILGECEDGFCFDAEGFYTAQKKRTSVAQRFGKNQTMGVLLNLDEKSPNFNTVSLFHNGERYSEPQPLPEALKGKTLYPHVSYRNVSVHVNFGPNPMAPLPFKCTTVQKAAIADLVVEKSSVPADGKYQVVFPVAFPDEGTFDWLDTFLEKNPGYVELSDRKIIEWAAKSGLVKPKSTGHKNSGDKPEFNYGLTAMDDLSCQRVLKVVAPFVPRNYVVMEVKENLTEQDRVATLKRFSNPMYKKVASVVMGEPDAAFKKVVHAKLLKEKKEKAVTEWKARKVEKEKKKQLAIRSKQLADMRKKAEAQKKIADAEKKKKAEENKKKREAEAAKKKAEAATKKAEAAKQKAEEAKEKAEAAEEAEKEAAEKAAEEAETAANEAQEAAEKATEEEIEKAAALEIAVEAEVEETKEEEKEEAKVEEAAEEEPEEPEPTDIELTEEDKKTWFRPPPVSDLTTGVLNSAFGKFTLPQKSEGFDDIKYEWEPATKANDYLRKWVLDRKVTSKMEDLKPSDWFKEKHEIFNKAVKEWQAKQKPFVEKKKKEEAEKKKKAAEKKKAGEEPEEEAEETKDEELDIFAVENVCDVGNGDPLFVDFAFEDWALMTLCYELFLLVQAFMHDADDEDRKGIHETNLSYYYNKYYHKTLTAKHYGKETNQAVLDMIKDSVAIDKDSSILGSNLEPDVEAVDIFVKLTEEGRRERTRRLDAGDETARLKFNPMLSQVTKPAPALPVSTKTAAPGALLRPGVSVARPVGPAAGAWGKGAAMGPYGAYGAGKGKW